MSDTKPTRRLIGPFNRVEGDLEVQIEIADGQVSKAWVNSPLYRGFEQILNGKDPRDALVVTPRICGICSVSQSVAAARALAQIEDVEMADNGRLATNLILASENLADHLSHFYLFFMPDFARTSYADKPWYSMIGERFTAQRGSASRDLLPARAELLHTTGILAGKWPHSLALQPGGTTRAIESRERLRLQAIMLGLRRFLERTLFADKLEAVAALASQDELREWAEAHPDSDFGRFLMLAGDLDLHRLGRASDNFMSYGAYPTRENNSKPLFAIGTWQQGLAPLRTNAITEDISHSWMHAQRKPRHPFEGSTLPDADAEGAYSWCKAPRYDGDVMEVGALARQQIDGHPLIRELVDESGGNVRNRVIARLLEVARVVPVMEQWVQAMDIGKPFCNHGKLPEEAEGFGLVEAARGSLGHWIKVKHHRILNYQIVAPTTWNFSPRDEQERPGALEQALAGTPIDGDGKDTVAIQHIVRSFDPCMVCTVH